jgi:hypothetical protein
MQHHGIGRRIKAIDRTNGCAWRVRAVHAGHGYGAFARLSVIQRDDAAAVYAPGNLVLVLARGDAGVAFDATIGVAKKFHARHGLTFLYAARI